MSDAKKLKQLCNAGQKRIVFEIVPILLKQQKFFLISFDDLIVVAVRVQHNMNN